MRVLTLTICCVALPSAVLAVPRPRPIEYVDYRITKRHRPVSELPPTIAFKAFRSGDGFVLHKLHGPETIQVLLGDQMKGDFIADLEVEIAGFRELGIGANGGTPVPYYGFRSSDGQHEALFSLSTYGGGWHSLSIQMKREDAKITARRDRMDQAGYQPQFAGPGYVCFVMNDTSKLRIRHLSITPIATPQTKKMGN